MKKILFTTTIAVLSLFLIVAARQSANSENLKSYTGEVLSIEVGGVKDAVFKIRNEKSTFYINRGFETIKTAELTSLVGKTATIYCKEGWNILDPFNKGSKHIEKLTINNSVFLSN